MSDAKELKWDHAEDDVAPNKMPEDDTVTAIVDGDLRAKFKIEIHFGPDRTTKRDFKALVLLMESGKFFHGGGDEQMYLCMDHRPFEKNNTTPQSALPTLRLMKAGRTPFGCGTPIPTSLMGGGIAQCPGCKSIINSLHLTSAIPFYGSLRELAQMVEILFHSLGDDADIYCKYHPTDIRYRTQAEFKGVETARRLRGLFIYPLHRIMTDLSSGASLIGRLTALFIS